MAIKNRLYTYPNGQPSDGNKLQAEFDNVYGATQGVASDQLASDSVTTEKLVNGSVTEPKLASNSVNTLKLVDLAVTDAKVATGISQSKLSATGWVTDIVIASALASSQAETTANTANSTASTANTKADTAISTANTASTTANTANTKADTAITTANTAKLTADTVSADYSVQLPLINAGLDSIALKVDKTYVDASIAGLIVGTMPDGSVTNAKLDANLKSKIVQVDANSTAIGSGTLSTTSQNLIGAINENVTKQGSLASLTTTDKTSLVNATNELNASLAQKVSKAGDTMTGNLNVPSINSKTPAYAIAPTETVITTGFATGWSGNLKIKINQEGLKTLIVFAQKTTDILSSAETFYVLPAGNLRPSANVYYSSQGYNISTAEVSGSTCANAVIVEGNIITTNVGTVKTGVRTVFSTVCYY